MERIPKIALMPIAPGLYLIQQTSPGKSGVDHYGILNIGNRLNQPGMDRPIVYHNTPPNLMAQWLHDTGVQWKIVQKIEDEAGATRRLAEAWQKGSYDTLGNNCEHFAFYVAAGERKSPQVRGGLAFAGLIGLAVALIGSNSELH